LSKIFLRWRLTLLDKTFGNNYSQITKCIQIILKTAIEHSINDFDRNVGK